MLRVISGVVLLTLVVAALWLLQPIYLVGIAAVIALAAHREFVGIAARAGVRISRPAGSMAAALMVVAIGIPGLPIDAALAGVILGTATVALSSGMAPGSDAQPLQTAAVSVFAPLYIGVPLGLLAATRWMMGREAALLLIVTVAASDTAQYYTGRVFGRRPLAPAISPKKTVEGAIGGFIAGPLVVAILGALWLPHVGLVWRIVIGFAVAAVGVVGDLFESLLKRSAGMKDASAIIPGHGGVLDRIDALLFAAPVFYVLVRYRL